MWNRDHVTWLSLLDKIIFLLDGLLGYFITYNDKITETYPKCYVTPVSLLTVGWISEWLAVIYLIYLHFKKNNHKCCSFLWQQYTQRQSLHLMLVQYRMRYKSKSLFDVFEGTKDEEVKKTSLHENIITNNVQYRWANGNHKRSKYIIDQTDLIIFRCC